MKRLTFRGGQNMHPNNNNKNNNMYFASWDKEIAITQ